MLIIISSHKANRKLRREDQIGGTDYLVNPVQLLFYFDSIILK